MVIVSLKNLDLPLWLRVWETLYRWLQPKPVIVVNSDCLIDARFSAVDPHLLMIYRSVLVKDDQPIYRPVAELLTSRPHVIEMDHDWIEDPDVMFRHGHLTHVRFL